LNRPPPVALAVLGKGLRRMSDAADRVTDFARWSNPEQLRPEWDARAAFAAQFIPAGATVLDLGCGAMALERSLPLGARYIPSDLAARDDRTIVCNLNAGEFPFEAALKADVVTFLGVAEYLADVPEFFAKLRRTERPVVFSYCPRDFTAHMDRPAVGWINAYSISDIEQILAAAGFHVVNREQFDQIQMVYKVDVRAPRPVKTKRLAVVSYLNLGNFGDRLGYHLLHAAIPANVEVEHYAFDPWPTIDVDGVDLVCIGIGNSIFQPLLTDQLQDLVNRSPKAIGIFGTQYRRSIDRNRLGALLKGLDAWYARYEEDLFLYGDLATKAVHLGDWLIDAFPMAAAKLDEALVIGDEIWNDLPLDRTIQRIQRYKRVQSPRLHPLLCALTSAELVAYVEQGGADGQEASGKFRSMLYDVFARTYPENMWWRVDREKVVRYKVFVSGQIAKLRADMQRLLHD
jgi:hypothetical protein